MSRKDTRSLKMSEVEAILERYMDEQKILDRRFALLTYVTSQVGGMKKKGGGQFSIEDFLIFQSKPSKMTVDEMERKMKNLTLQMGGKVVGKG